MGSQVTGYEQSEIDRMEEKMRSAIVPAEPQEIENSNALTLVLNRKNWALTHPVEYQARMHNILVDFVQRVMVKEVDYGLVSGCGDKPMLFKPGAEKILNLFRMNVRFELVDSVQDWDKPLFSYDYKAIVRGPDNQIIAECDSNCNSWEKKYRYRTVNEKWAKPEEKAAAVSTKQVKNGKYTDTLLVIPNDDIFSQINTLKKMAQKRALTGAVVIAANASAFFQNIDKMSEIDLDEDVEPIDAEIVTSPPHTPTPTSIKKKTQKVESVDLSPEYVSAQVKSLLSAYDPPFTPDDVKNLIADGLQIPNGSKAPGWTEQHLEMLGEALQEEFEARIDTVDGENIDLEADEL